MENPLSDIRHYSPTMTIAQVLKFCEKKSMAITRAMIQNYIKIGLLPPPVNSRFYTHKHLAVLAVVDRLKTVCDIKTILELLSPCIDDEGLSLNVYFDLTGRAEELIQNFITANAEIFTNEQDGGALLAMACAAELKNRG